MNDSANSRHDLLPATSDLGMAETTELTPRTRSEVPNPKRLMRAYTMSCTHRHLDLFSLFDRQSDLLDPKLSNLMRQTAVPGTAVGV